MADEKLEASSSSTIIDTVSEDAIANKKECCPETGQAAGQAASTDFEWIGGGRLAAVGLGQSLAMFMIQTEASITSTAVTAITDEFGGFERSSWIFTSYLITYGAFPIIFANLSDILTRKAILLGCLALFTSISGACGGSQSLTQLIMFRWIQGIGAGGVLAICTGYTFDMLPPSKWPRHSALLMLVIAVSVSIAPVIGAALTQAGQWRWCFLLNVPIGIVTMVIFLFTMPGKLKHEPAARLAGPQPWRQRVGELQKVDYLGSGLLIGCCTLLTAALQQASQGTSYVSVEFLLLLVLSPIFAIALAGWQRLIHVRSMAVHPIFSWTLLTNRPLMFTICTSWLYGMLTTCIVVQIPQRLILGNGLSAMQAGVRLLVYPATAATISAIFAISSKKIPVHAVYWLLGASFVGIAGIAGLSQTSQRNNTHALLYCMEVVTALGLGIVGILVVLLGPHLVARPDIAVSNGAINQARILGGSHGVAIVTCATTPALRRWLLEFLKLDQVNTILSKTETIVQLPPSEQVMVRAKFSRMYQIQTFILLGIAGAQVVSVLLQWQRKPVILKS